MQKTQAALPGTGGILYLVPTPLGNLQDITFRAVEQLKQADLIACEDTRRTVILLNHLGISKPLWSYHAHSPARKTQELLGQLRQGKNIALVCDAGTPGISDPGEALVKAVVAEGLPIVSLPGPCAAITALVASGLPTDRFFFIGFLPRRPARARRALQQALSTGGTVVIYESPYRTEDTVQRLLDLAGPDAPVVVARELTKVYEEMIRGTATKVLAYLQANPPRGEVVIMAHAKESEEE